MGDSSISARDLATFTKTLGDFLPRFRSWENLESWLKSQPGVVSVSTAAHLVKTEPPRKEVSVTFKIDDGSTVTKVIDVILFPDQTFGLAGVHQP
jgi:hypothetical protein